MPIILFLEGASNHAVTFFFKQTVSMRNLDKFNVQDILFKAIVNLGRQNEDGLRRVIKGKTAPFPPLMMTKKSTAMMTITFHMP